MKLRIWPKTRLGTWASGLTLLFIVLMALKLLGLAAAIRLPLPTPVLAVLGVIGFVLGIISFFRNKDRALFVLLSILVGAVIILWAAAETAFPH